MFRNLIDAIGGRRLDEITLSDADRFASGLVHLAKSTRELHLRLSKQLFRATIDRGLIDRNPFAHFRGLKVAGDPQRRMFIPESDVLRLLEVIPDPQLRLVIALARFGSLRVPSESNALK